MIKQITTIAAFLILTLTLAGTVAADEFGSGVNMFDIDFVTIGNPNNADDTTGSPNPAGSVAYTYQMGKFEVSEDMIDKANAEAGLGITQDTRGPNKPATNISWNEAARFVNWLNTSTGNAAAYKFALQPGDGGYDSNANIQLWDPSDAGYDPNNLFRNSQAKYFLPSLDEWYKAAYYDPTSGTYFDYPTGSDTAPTPVAFATSADTAVFIQPFSQGPADVSLAGGLSPYGTRGQGGNAYEWEESEFDLVNDSSSSARGIRGGSWAGSSSFLQSSNRPSSTPAGEISVIGFRVASSLPGDVFGSGSNTFGIEFVTICDPGNPDDTTGDPNPAGSVGYTYRIGKFEISEEMIDKANIEGGLGITLQDMTSFGGNGPNRPATGVSWNEAARFVNWLNTSTGYPAAYKFEFQPGEAGYHSNANIQLWDPGDAGYNPNNLFRNSQTKYVLPSYDEWYKAAYYDPTSGTYFDYPTGSDSTPTAGTAVYDQPLAQGPFDVSLAGGPSPYGTRGQGGNVYEWEESATDLMNDNNSEGRGLRGGSWDANSSTLQSSARLGSGIGGGAVGSRAIGFRVASSFPLGDANDDEVFNNLDIASFVLALTNPVAYAAAYPGVDPDVVLDMNCDGVFNNLDIASFVAALTGP